MRARRSAVLGLALVGALAGAACSSSPSDDGSGEANATAAQKEDMFDVNDVSILFSRNPKPFPEITLDETLKTGLNLWSAAQFAQVIKVAQAQGIQFSNGGDKRENWRIFSMRFDPCAPGINSTGPGGVNGDRKNCSVQVRLIAQPLTADGKSMQDISAHLVYTLGQLEGPNKVDLVPIRAGLAAIKAASVAAKAPTAGQPLGIHPGLDKEDAAVAEAVHTFIRTQTAKVTSMAIAFMGLKNDGFEPWVFFAGAIANPTAPTDVANGFFVTLAQTPLGGLPNLAKGTTSEVLSFVAPAAQRVSPEPTGTSTFPLFQSGASDAAGAAFRIENPTATHFFTTDCVSCHTSTSRTAILGTKSMSARARVPAGITGYVSSAVQQNSTWNVRNFGWFAGKPSVSLRTVNETVDVVQVINEGHRPTGGDKAASFFGPGNDCSAVDDAVWNCFQTNKDAQGGATCMTTNACTPFPLDPPKAPAAQKPTGPLDPQIGQDDPCVATPDLSDLQSADQGDVRTATFTGKSAECLARPLGAFRSEDGKVAIVCESGEQCTVSIPTATPSVTLTGNDAKRLDAQMIPVSSTRSFKAVSKDGATSVSIGCTGADASTSCTIAIGVSAAP